MVGRNFGEKPSDPNMLYKLTEGRILLVLVE